MLIGSKKVFAVLGFVLLTVTGASVTHADSFVDEQYSAPNPPDSNQEYAGLYVDDSTQAYAFGGSYAVGIKASVFNPENPSTWDAVARCKSIDDASCMNANYDLWQSYLAPCSSTLLTNCIQSLSATKPDGTTEQANLVANYPSTFDDSFAGNDLEGIPNGATPTLWQFPSVTHSGGGNEFLLATAFGEFGYHHSLQDSPNFSTAIYPVTIKSANLFKMGLQIDTTRNANNGYSLLGWTQAQKGCIFNDETSCAVDQPFPTGVRFTEVVRTTALLAGWLNGRLANPNISFSQDSQGNSILTITGEPVKVPVFSYWTPKSSLQDPLKTVVSNLAAKMQGQFYCNQGNSICSHQYSLSGGSIAYNQPAMDVLSAFLAAEGNTSVAEKSEWSVHSTNNIQGSITESCRRDNNALDGLVTTNGTMYVGSPPTYDASAGTLNYTVESPHLDHNGSPNQGFYSLILRSDVARCLYNYPNVPLKAQISIISADGNQQIATTNFAEKDGWLLFSANGFSYSNPTISIKLTPAAAPLSSPSPSSAPLTTAVSGARTASTAPAIKFTCIKGKVVKYVTAKNPACPTGYKKK